MTTVTTNAVIVRVHRADSGSAVYTVFCDGQTYTRADPNIWSQLYGAGIDREKVGKTPVTVSIPCEWDGKRVVNIPQRLRYDTPAQRVKVIDAPQQTTHVSVWLVVAVVLVVVAARTIVSRS